MTSARQRETPPARDGFVDTAVIPHASDTSSVLIKIDLADSVQINASALAAMRGRAEDFASRVGLDVTKFYVEQQH